MSYSDDESLPGECDWCHDDRGLCDRPHLDEDRGFSIKLEVTFNVETVRNDDKCYFFVIKHDFNYFNVYFSSFPIRLAYPVLCKMLCLGENGF